MTYALIDIFGLTGSGLVSIIGAGGKTRLMFTLAKELTAAGRTVLTTTTTKIFLPGPDQSPHTVVTDSFDDLLRQSRSGLCRHRRISAGSGIDPAHGKLIGFPPDVINRLFRASVFDWIIVEADGARQKPVKATDRHEPVIPEDTSHLVLVTGLDAVGTPLDDDHVHRAEIFAAHTGLAFGDILTETAIAGCLALEIKKAAAMAPRAVHMVFLNKADTPERIASGHEIARLVQSQAPTSRIIIAALMDPDLVKAIIEPALPS